MLLGCGAGERRTALRGVSQPLRHRCQPATPLDARRLADRRLAGTPRHPGRWQHGTESPVEPVAVENLRQPAPQPCRARTDGAAAAWMDCPATGIVLDP